MPSRISFAQEIAYLRTLGDTGNASLAAAQAGVSRDWAYKRRLADARLMGCAGRWWRGSGICRRR